MATIAKLKSGNYRVQIRRNGQYASKPFQKMQMRCLGPLKLIAEQIKAAITKHQKSQTGVWQVIAN